MADTGRADSGAGGRVAPYQTESNIPDDLDDEMIDAE